MTKGEICFGMKKNCSRKRVKGKEPCILGNEFFMHSFRKGKKNGLLLKVSANTCFSLCLYEEQVSSLQPISGTPANCLLALGRTGKYHDSPKADRKETTRIPIS